MSKYTLESCTVETLDRVNLGTRFFKAKEEIKDNIVIVLVHPYPILGGCQALLKGIASGLAEKGYKAVTFDMRGVGRSTGRASFTGFAEFKDVIAVCNWVSRNLSSDKILLVSSSAGTNAGFNIYRIKSLVSMLSYQSEKMAPAEFGRKFIRKPNEYHKQPLNSSKM